MSRKGILSNLQIDKTLVQSQVSSLEAQVAHYLRRTVGDLDVRLGEVKATYARQVLEQLQQTNQHLREIETTLGPAPNHALHSSGPNPNDEGALRLSLFNTHLPDTIPKLPDANLEEAPTRANGVRLDR